MKWIEAHAIASRGVTKAWLIAPIGTGTLGPGIGEVRFYPQWRKYAFFPYQNTLFETDCLRDIATFCEERTREWRESIKARKASNG